MPVGRASSHCDQLVLLSLVDSAYRLVLSNLTPPAKFSPNQEVPMCTFAPRALRGLPFAENVSRVHRNLARAWEPPRRGRRGGCRGGAPAPGDSGAETGGGPRGGNGGFTGARRALAAVPRAETQEELFGHVRHEGRGVRGPGTAPPRGTHRPARGEPGAGEGGCWATVGVLTGPRRAPRVFPRAQTQEE